MVLYPTGYNIQDYNIEGQNEYNKCCRAISYKCTGNTDNSEDITCPTNRSSKDNFENIECTSSPCNIEHVAIQGVEMYK